VTYVLCVTEFRKPYPVLQSGKVDQDGKAPMGRPTSKGIVVV